MALENENHWDSLPWDCILPNTDFRFTLGISSRTGFQFYSPSVEHRKILREKWTILRDHIDCRCSILPESVALLEESSKFLGSQIDLTSPIELPGIIGDEVRNRIGVLTADVFLNLEADVVFLRRSGSSSPVVVGGIVCFPSNWDLREKLGKPLEDVHSVVPNLNRQLSGGITRFLASLQPGASYERYNWGIAAVPDRDHHPSKKHPRPTAKSVPSSLWFRLESQSIILLPTSDGLLFGIKIEVMPLEWVLRDRNRADGLLRSLESMPPALAEYKGILGVRDRIMEYGRSIHGRVQP